MEANSAQTRTKGGAGCRISSNHLGNLLMTISDKKIALNIDLATLCRNSDLNEVQVEMVSSW